MTNAASGGWGLSGSHLHMAVHHPRKSGQELTQGGILEAGADAEAMEGLLTGLFLMARSACFLLDPRTTSPGMAPPTVGWGPLSITTAWPLKSPSEDDFSLRQVAQNHLAQYLYDNVLMRPSAMYNKKFTCKNL